ncbi:MAG: hypothetical protein HFE75_12395 [Firmicutes bacterium]|jgi:peptidoglycan hydrolase CwlO-like protein|nr:hypothetical protein [Bacillota bacterium]NBI63184.1 hypothetical protein [Clostridiales bacterium]
MLETRDLKLIAEVVQQSVRQETQPIRDDIASLQADIKEVKADITELKADVAVLKDDMEGAKVDIMGLKNHMSVAQNDIKAIQVTLENETNQGVRIIAEGHMDLDRKLNTVLKSEKEKAMMLLRTMRLENEVEKMKTKLEATA